MSTGRPRGSAKGAYRVLAVLAVLAWVGALAALLTGHPRTADIAGYALGAFGFLYTAIWLAETYLGRWRPRQ